ncbi:uncharacterized protein N7482_009465 [Penicillium canariense]|uniref:Vacuolar ATPase assembly protein VMA22 n=1 Tax=Penicillium canariense TaxID=189055 RepID=A0A9W9HPA0_9EURO|nr:uncharacterized protein N7482_009465 [Penicillium canariense]KAJ5152987.1 hypothetical protein N7482_009465 [Penicillium canariense]
MSQVPTPPPSRPGSEAPEPVSKPAGASSELQLSLDALLEQYLHLLDRQQKLQSGLAKQLSSGFLSLAHANYTCPPGRRYGADYYDERMKATRNISIHAESEVDDSAHQTELTDGADGSRPDGFYYNFRLETVANRPAEENTEKTDDQVDNDPASREATNTESPRETDTSSSQDSSADTAAPKETKIVRKKFRSDDPIYWYGILVPPSLRTAQKSFTDAVLSHVPELAGAIVEMRALEQKIAQVRSELSGNSSEKAGSQ